MNNKFKKAITILGVVGILLGCVGCSDNTTAIPDDMSQFDAEGNSTEEAYSISDLLDDGGFDNAIIMNIIPVE